VILQTAPHHHLLPHPFGATGYLAIFLVVALENVGVPFPGETALLAGAALASSGRLNLAGVITAATLGAIVGGGWGYAVGRIGGLPLIERYGARFGLTRERLQHLSDFFARHGGKTVFFGRFVALLRAWAASLAGAAQMPVAQFFFYTTLGAIVWACAFGALGYTFGKNLPVLEHDIALATVCIVGVVVVALAAAFISHRITRPKSTPSSPGT
jgi:membrane protein DedA with SNARE-associated domain